MKNLVHKLLVLCSILVFMPSYASSSSIIKLKKQNDKCIAKYDYIAGINGCLNDYLTGYQKILYKQKNFDAIDKKIYEKKLQACENEDDPRPNIYDCQITVTEKMYKQVK